MPTYADIRRQIESFDIILFSGKGLISTIIQAATGSQWSHVALALYLPQYDQILCYESTTLSNIPDLTTGAKVKGVQLVPLSQRIASYDGQVAWRNIRGARTEEMKLESAKFIREFAGRPYEENQLELIKSALDTDFLLKENQPDASSVFCSEMNCLLHRRVGIQRDGQPPANEFTPADFSDNLPMVQGYILGPVVELQK